MNLAEKLRAVPIEPQEEILSDNDRLKIKKIELDCTAEAAKGNKCYKHPGFSLSCAIVEHFKREGIKVSYHSGCCTRCGSSMSYGCTCDDSVPWTGDYILFEW